MASWFKSKKNTNGSQDDESSASRERLVPRDENEAVATERTRLLGQYADPVVEPSPYNLVVIRSLRNISIDFPTLI